jgi:hypothetical protein
LIPSRILTIDIFNEWLNQIVDCTCRLNSLNKLTPILNKEGFATMFDVTPDKFQTIIDNMESKNE